MATNTLKKTVWCTEIVHRGIWWGIFMVLVVYGIILMNTRHGRRWSGWFDILVTAFSWVWAKRNQRLLSLSVLQESGGRERERSKFFPCNPKLTLFLVFSSKNNFFKTQGTKLGAIVAPNENWEKALLQVCCILIALWCAFKSTYTITFFYITYLIYDFQLSSHFKFLT